MAINGGWTGKVLRVNLSDGSITEESTEKYKDYLGGMGLGYKVIWDEVPEGISAFDEENKIVFGVGPLTGSGVGCSGRTNITSLMPTVPGHLVADSHMGGHWGPELKFAGWDSIIIEGKADKPVWLKIENENVSIEDASSIWGNGIFRATTEITQIMGPEARVAAIGQAGENEVPMATILNDGSHSAGGHGGVMGSKKLKAIGVKGNNPVRVADPEKWRELDEELMEVIGSNNQHVVPTTPQAWAEYHDSGTRWWAYDGNYWQQADPPINTGDCDIYADNWKNTIGYRCHKASDIGAADGQYTVRQGGCHACPVRCHTHAKATELEKYGYSSYKSNTCVGWFAHTAGWWQGDSADPTIARMLGSQLADDYGIWDNYMLTGNTFGYMYREGLFEEILPEDEYEDIPWDKMEAGDPEFLIDIYKRIAFKEGEISKLGWGTGAVAKEWGIADNPKFWEEAAVYNPKLFYRQHHAHETYNQVGALLNVMFNRDAQLHTHVNLFGCGLPHEYHEKAMEQIHMVGSGDAVDEPGDYTPVNEYKAKYAVWSIVRNLLHDSLTLCNWMWPMQVSPRKERDYMGNTALEADFMTAVTGEEYTEEELDDIGMKLFTLHRALTVKQMGTVDMRNEHDVFSDWIFEETDMEEDDLQEGLTLIYRVMGWCEETGAPTRESLENYGLGYVADELADKNLLP
ncbi:aldehyde ferredoxin oxidoreductase [Natranaerofaba carboxydovora]|uniref:aldehyde ferredoxin oxidoreductase n=1 Tax=Natranaerofaba carboxydovora TaxID=2742683 RepID=UPI001F129724|nr:aldehyde ferredoxin oxidoreductase [Natranaerofaba carboxydovora]UMZ72906.1 putative oxidoreductase YdhV [Natranaerofaba carboxydovora]